MRIRVARRRFVPVLFSLSFTPLQTGTVDQQPIYGWFATRRARALDSAARGG
jgi:hypothetical protein